MANAPEGIICPATLKSVLNEVIGKFEGDFYYELPIFLQTPYLYNEQYYSNWKVYNFEQRRADSIDLENLSDIEENPAYINQNGQMEFIAISKTNFPIALQYGPLSQIYNTTTNTLTNIISLTPGTVRLGYDNNKALLFWDSGTQRLPIAVSWSHIYDRPTNLATQDDITSIENSYLPLGGGTMTGDINLGTNNGLIGTTLSLNSFDVFRVYNGNTLIVGGSHPALQLKGSLDTVTYNEKNLAFSADIPTLTDNQDNSFSLIANNITQSTWTANNYYPTELTWEQTTNSLQGKITIYNNGDAKQDLNITTDSIPVASPSHNGIITTNDQDIGGIKNFTNSIKLSDKVHLLYNTATESLDFTFLFEEA